MKKLFLLWLPLCWVSLSASVSVFAEPTRPDHRSDQVDFGDVRFPGDSAATYSGAIMGPTRREVLARGIREAQLRPQTLEEIVRITSHNPRMDLDAFNGMIDSMEEAASIDLTKDQGKQLKRLFREELGMLKNSDLGTEFSQAASQVLKEVKNPGRGNGDPSAPGSGSGQAAGNSKQDLLRTAATNPLNSVLLGKLFDQFYRGTPQTKAENSEDSSKVISNLQDLIKGLEGKMASIQGRSGRSGDSKGRPSLLEALRTALAEQKKDDKDDKDGTGKEGNEKLADLLKNAMTHRMPPPAGKRKEDAESGEPDFRPERPERETSNRGSESPMVISLGREGGSGDSRKNNSDADRKNEKPFDLGGGSSKKKELEKPAKEKSENDLAKTLDTSALDSALKDLKEKPKKKSSVKMTPLPGIQGGDSGSGFSDFSSLGFSGGGGSDLANFGGTVSAIPSAGFDGDPFSSVGVMPYGESWGPYEFTKSVGYGGSVSGDDMSADDTAGIVDIGSFEIDGDSSDQVSRTTPLFMSPLRAAGSKRTSILDYVGNIGRTLCEGKRKERVEVCSRIDSGKPLAAGLRKGRNPFADASK